MEEISEQITRWRVGTDHLRGWLVNFWRCCVKIITEQGRNESFSNRRWNGISSDKEKDRDYDTLLTVVIEKKAN